MKMHTQQPKVCGTQWRQSWDGSSYQYRPTKKDTNISNNQPNPTSARTGGIITSKAQSEQKEGNNQDQSRSEWHRDKKKKFEGSINPAAGSLKM